MERRRRAAHRFGDRNGTTRRFVRFCIVSLTTTTRTRLLPHHRRGTTTTTTTPSFLLSFFCHHHHHHYYYNTNILFFVVVVSLFLFQYHPSSIPFCTIHNTTYVLVSFIIENRSIVRYFVLLITLLYCMYSHNYSSLCFTFFHTTHCNPFHTRYHPSVHPRRYDSSLHPCRYDPSHNNTYLYIPTL